MHAIANKAVEQLLVLNDVIAVVDALAPKNVDHLPIVVDRDARMRGSVKSVTTGEVKGRLEFAGPKIGIAIQAYPQNTFTGIIDDVLNKLHGDIERLLTVDGGDHAAFDACFRFGSLDPVQQAIKHLRVAHAFMHGGLKENFGIANVSGSHLVA